MAMFIINDEIRNAYVTKREHECARILLGCRLADRKPHVVAGLLAVAMFNSNVINQDYFGLFDPSMKTPVAFWNTGSNDLMTNLAGWNEKRYQQQISVIRKKLANTTETSVNSGLKEVDNLIGTWVISYGTSFLRMLEAEIPVQNPNILASIQFLLDYSY